MTTQPEVPLTGRAPTTPCDFYVITKVPAAHIEHAIPGTLNSALVCTEIVSRVNIVAGGMVQGLNVTITLDNASYRGATACSIYALLDMGTGAPSISGRSSVIEAKLKQGVSAGVLGIQACLCLDFENENTVNAVTQAAAYIMLRERSAAARRMTNLFNFMDISPSAATSDKLFVASTDAGTISNFRLKFMASGIYYWVMCTTSAPA